MDAFLTDVIRLLEARHADFDAAFAGLSPEAVNWQPGEGLNSLAALAVHSAGAERFWIGDVIMWDSSQRDRLSEFETVDVTAEQALAKLRVSLDYARSALERLALADLHASRVHPFSGREVTVGWAILHALEHTAMHAGHAQLTRQLWGVR